MMGYQLLLGVAAEDDLMFKTILDAFDEESLKVLPAALHWKVAF